jgi:hypothetical protein
MRERKIKQVSPFNGEVIAEETFYFQLSKADFVEMDLMSIFEGKNAVKMLKVAKEMIVQAAGVKEGNRLSKTGVKERFVRDGWWDALFEELFQEDNPMDFIIGMLPEDVRQEIAAEHAKTYTDAELMAMSDKDFYKAAGTDQVSEMDKRFVQIAFTRKTHRDVA